MLNSLERRDHFNTQGSSHFKPSLLQSDPASGLFSTATHLELNDPLSSGRFRASAVTPQVIPNSEQRLEMGLNLNSARLSATAVSLDSAGNSLSTARNIDNLSSLQTFNDFVGTADPNDYYRFTLTTTSTLNLLLSGLSANADVQLIRDTNGNRVVDYGEVIASSSQYGTSSETLIRALGAGTYFIRVYQSSGDTNYTLSLSATPEPRDNAGNTLPDARNIGNLSSFQTFNDFVGTVDPSDYYRFTVDTPSTLNAFLTGLSANADLQLIQDSNANGMVDYGEVIAESLQYGTSLEVLNRPLTAGTYFIRVYQYYQNIGDTNYVLSLSATPFVAPPDHAGNTLTTARDIGDLSTSQIFNDFVGVVDTNDYYRFTLTTTSAFNLLLNGFSVDANVQLIQDINGNGAVDDDEVIAFSQYGTSSKTLTTALSEGTYFIRVYQSSGDTNYTLSLSATPAPPDNAGNTLATARDISGLSSFQTFNDFVGVVDPNDYYRFTLDTPSTLNAFLTGLSANADLQLIRDTNSNGVVDYGEVIIESRQFGTVPEMLTRNLNAGTYFIRVHQNIGDTNYALSLSTTSLNLPTGYDLNYGYGMVNAAVAVAKAIAQSPFSAVPNLGGNFWGLDMVNAPEVWAQGYTGQNIVVAVVDSGVDYTHSDLDANIWVNPNEIAGNNIDDDGNGYIDDLRGWDFVGNDNAPTDVYGHGTHVAGTIAAENNGVGITGVAYNARIMPVKVLGDYGYGTNSNIAAGIRYAANSGAQVINLSLGGGGYSSEIATAVQYATQRGAVVVFSAGNEYALQPSFPADLASRWGITVGAVNSSKQMAGFSNRAGAPALSYVVAPGVSVYSTTPNNNYQSYSGTSMAAPHVAGVAALMLSANPNLTPDQVRNLLTETANLTGITG